MVDDVSLSNYEDARFICQGSIFTLSFTSDKLQLNYIQTVQSSILDKTLIGNQWISFENIINASSIEHEQNQFDGTFHIRQTAKNYPLKPYSLVIHHYVKKSNKTWKRRSLYLHSHNQLMTNYLSILVMNRTNEYIKEHNYHRPNKLLVFVNPYGGRKKAKPIYLNIVAPIFSLAGIECKVVYTEYQNHARKIVEQEDVNSYCGIIAVGGDGILNEIINGLLHKTQKLNNVSMDVSQQQLCSGFRYKKPKVRVGIIPAGSTNALVFSMQGIDDPETAALHIVVGDSHPLDLCSIHSHSGSFIRYSFAMTSYGFYGNILRESEQLRKLGPVRYDLAGLKTFFKLHSHEAEVSYLLSDYEDRHNVAEDRTRCRYPCHVCGADEDSKSGLNTSSSLTLNSHNVTSVSDEAEGGWKTERGKFTVVSSSLMSCACRKSPLGLSPSAHLSDGNTDLILVRKCSKFDFFRYLLSHTGSADRFRFPFVDVKRVIAFKYKCLNNQLSKQDSSLESSDNEYQSKTSCWNTDGEFINSPNITLWVHRGLVDMFARGIEP